MSHTPATPAMAQSSAGVPRNAEAVVPKSFRNRKLKGIIAALGSRRSSSFTRSHSKDQRLRNNPQTLMLSKSRVRTSIDEAHQNHRCAPIKRQLITQGAVHRYTTIPGHYALPVAPQSIFA